MSAPAWKAGGLLLVALACAASISVAEPPTPKSRQEAEARADLPSYAVFSGSSGYEEIRLSDDTWYLGFFGTRAHSIEVLSTAWAARAAQLCGKSLRPYFVQLRYIGEAVLVTDPPKSQIDSPAFMRPVGVGYVPIFIPMPQSTGPITVSTPAKEAPLRCIAGPETLKDPARAVATVDALATARKTGFLIPEATQAASPASAK